MSEVYNPLSKLNLGKSVAEALLDRDPVALGDIPPFDGAGIYAIYYDGQHEAYERLADVNEDEWRIPIYIGKAIPSGGRRGKSAFTEVRGRFVHNRLAEHADSIRLVDDLHIEDFAARWLIVDDIWIPLGETLLISKFQPVWNVLLDGFGNHDPGAGRYQGMRPMWDVVHTGRRWAPRLRDRPESRDALVLRVQSYLAEQEFEDDPRISFAPAT